MFTLTSRVAPQKDISRPFLNDTGRSKIAEWNTLTSRWLTSLSKNISAKADTKECKISLISFFFPSLTKTYGPKKNYRSLSITYQLFPRQHGRELTWHYHPSALFSHYFQVRVVSNQKWTHVLFHRMPSIWSMLETSQFDWLSHQHRWFQSHVDSNRFCQL